MSQRQPSPTESGFAALAPAWVRVIEKTDGFVTHTGSSSNSVLFFARYALCAEDLVHWRPASTTRLRKTTRVCHGRHASVGWPAGVHSRALSGNTNTCSDGVGGNMLEALLPLEARLGRQLTLACAISCQASPSPGPAPKCSGPSPHRDLADITTWTGQRFWISTFAFSVSMQHLRAAGAGQLAAPRKIARQWLGCLAASERPRRQSASSPPGP